MNTHTASSATQNNYHQMSIFQQEKLAWENAIGAYTGPDPLEMWFNYICWYEQNMAHDPNNDFEAVLGKCLSMYEYNENFKQDIRMVKLWMKYINLKPNPLNLFQVLYQRGVGTQCAVFYIGWAQYFDAANAFKHAESVYNLGFRAKAEPYSDLEAAHGKFRMLATQKMYNDPSNVSAANPVAATASTGATAPAASVQAVPARKRTASHMIDNNGAQQQQPTHHQAAVAAPPPPTVDQHQQHHQLQIKQQQQQLQQQYQMNNVMAKKSRNDEQHVHRESPQQQSSGGYNNNITTANNNHYQQPHHPTPPQQQANHLHHPPTQPPPSVSNIPPHHHSPVSNVISHPNVQPHPPAALPPPVPNIPHTSVSRAHHQIPPQPQQHHLNNNHSQAQHHLHQPLQHHHHHLSQHHLHHQQDDHVSSTNEHNQTNSNSTTNSISEQSNLNNVISSSLNFVYDSDGQTYEESLSQSAYDQLGINIPSNFVRVARNHTESWTGALFLEEPYEPNKNCCYPKHFVYPGNGCEYGLEEIRARRYEQRVAPIREYYRQREYERQRIREERQRIEMERQRIEQERLRLIEQERLRLAEQERLRIAAEQERLRLIEEERRRVAAAEEERQREIERIRTQQEERAQMAEYQQRLHEEELERQRIEAEQAEEERLRYEEEEEEEAAAAAEAARQYKLTNGYTTTTIVDSMSDDIEEQIEASTIRFSTGNGLTSKPKTITIKFRKEKPAAAAGTSTTTTPSTDTNTKVPTSVVSETKPKKVRKHKKDQNGMANNNMHDDANLLLSLSNLHSNDATTPSSTPIRNRTTTNQQHYTNLDDSFSNSDFYPYSAENSNSQFNFSASSTPIRSTNNNTTQQQQQQQHPQSSSSFSAAIKSTSSTPNNFKILKKRTSSNLSYQNDDSMCSTLSATAADQSFFAAENDEELRQKRLEKALQTITTHFAKKMVDPFSSELCKAFLTKISFPSREHSDSYKMIGTMLPKLVNTKCAMLASTPYQIEKEVGRGSYGSVYKATNGNTGEIVALKFQKPANNWELYICNEVRKKIKNSDVLLGFMDISTGIVAPNASIFVTEFSQYGSLLDINNRIRQATTKVMHESLVMHFSSQILNIVEHLHSCCKIIHADIKPDNFLLMKIPNPHSHVPTIRLIDFGCAIDMNFFEPNTQFYKRIETDGFTCIEMQENRPWSYQTDIFCIAGTVHVMLFGEYMQPVKKFGQWDIKTKLPRYLKKHVWSELFSKFLNIKDIDHMPNLLDIKSKIDDELYNMESELQSQIRTLSNILHKR